MFILALIFAFAISASECTTVTVDACCPAITSTTTMCTTTTDCHHVKQWFRILMEEYLPEIIKHGGTVCIRACKDSCTPEIIKLPGNACGKKCRVEVCDRDCDRPHHDCDRPHHDCDRPHRDCDHPNRDCDPTEAPPKHHPKARFPAPFISTDTPRGATVIPNSRIYSSSRVTTTTETPSFKSYNSGEWQLPRSGGVDCGVDCGVDYGVDCASEGGCEATVIISDPYCNNPQPYPACVRTCPCNYLSSFL